MNNNPIGVLDSGVGGLSVLGELRAQLPGESLLYYGDGKNCPYGPKPVGEVIGYVAAGVQLLVERGIKMLVVACNAATATAIDFLRAKYDFPIVGMEPAVKPAVMGTKTGVVGVLATANTLQGELFRATSARYADRAKILSAVGEGFVELVEEDKEDSPEALEAVRAALIPLIEAGADHIVLGCTLYPFLRAAMEKVIAEWAASGIGQPAVPVGQHAGQTCVAQSATHAAPAVRGAGQTHAVHGAVPHPVRIVDPAPAVAHRASTLLVEHGLAAEAGHRPEYEFFTAADDERYLKMLRRKSGFPR